MRLSKRQIKRIIREEKRKLIREGQMKRIYGEIQNAILACGQELGGEMTVDDCVSYVAEAVPMMNRPGSQYDEVYGELVDIMWDMVEDGMLTDGYEDFFSVHPDYM